LKIIFYHIYSLVSIGGSLFIIATNL